MTKNKDNTWIQTVNGIKFYPLKPTAEDIDIVDIAWSLSNLCRYNGHCQKYYSVAEHSIYVSQHVPKQFAMAGLLHDATEAYIGDIPTPIKAILPDIKHIEYHLLWAISVRFDLGFPLPDIVKKIDLAMLTTEAEQMMQPYADTWPQLIEKPLDIKIQFLSPLKAYYQFLKRYNEIKKGE